LTRNFASEKKKQTLMPKDDDGRSEEAKERSVRNVVVGAMIDRAV
jgi:hypothetical protein